MRSLVLHGDDFRGVDHVHRNVARGRMGGEFALELLFRPYQQDFHAIVTGREEDSLQLRPGSPIGTHGVNCYDSLHCLWRMALLIASPYMAQTLYTRGAPLKLKSQCQGETLSGQTTLTY